MRRERCIIHDDVMIVEPLNDNIDLDYLVQQLRAAIAAGNYEYEAKLCNRVKELTVKIPVYNGTEDIDLERQRSISDVLKRFDSLRTSLAELGEWSEAQRIRD